MNIQAVKLELIEWLTSLNDETMLQLLKTIKQSSPDHDWWDDLSESEQNIILKSLKSVKAGKGIESKNFWEKYEKHLQG